MDPYKIADTKRIVSTLSSRLDTLEIKEGSFLYKLTEAIISERDSAATSEMSVMKNMHIETCDTNTDNYFGNDIGLSKIEIPYMSILSSDNIAYIETPDGSLFPSFMNGKIVLSKGDRLTKDSLSLIANEDFIIDSSKNRVFVSCTISSSKNYVLSSSNGIRIDLNDNYLSHVNFKVLSDVSFTYIPESTAMFKNRIMLEKKNEGNRTPEFIVAYFNGIKGIEDVKIVQDEVSVLYFSTTDMVERGDETSAGVYQRIIKSELNKLLVWPAKYNVKKRDKSTLSVQFSIINSTKTSIDTITTSTTLRLSISSIPSTCCILNVLLDGIVYIS